MPGVKAQINWTGCAFASAPITRVTNASVKQGGKLLGFKGDLDIFNSVIAVVEQDPSIDITSADVGTMMGFIPGAQGSLTLTHKDANGTSGGDVIFTLSTAVFENADAQGAHAAFGSVVGHWKSVSSDGLTNPLSFTRA